MSNKTDFDVIIIGGGASGLAAATAFGRHSGGLSAAVIEKEEKPGRKLLATGNGRCNITNTDMSELHYNEASRALVKSVLQRIDTGRLISLFGSLGLYCRTDSEGRVYPYSNRALAVLDTFMMWLRQTGVTVICGARADSVEITENGFAVVCGGVRYTAKKLILSSGGAVQKNLGSDGSSYRFADELRLSCEPVFPSLAPVIVKDRELSAVRGVRASAAVTAMVNGVPVKTETGELQLNEKNISGICVFQLSRIINEAFVSSNEKDVCITADLAPDIPHSELSGLLQKKLSALPDAAAEMLFTGILNEKLGAYIFKKSNVKYKDSTLGALTSAELDKLCRTVKRCVFIPEKMSEYGAAQVTAGGISISEIDRNMQSKKHKGLYIIGEALDADGDCGGYNLHFAFASGIIAGTHAAKNEVKRHDKNKRA